MEISKGCFCFFVLLIGLIMIWLMVRFNKYDVKLSWISEVCVFKWLVIVGKFGKYILILRGFNIVSVLRRNVNFRCFFFSWVMKYNSRVFFLFKYCIFIDNF